MAPQEYEDWMQLMKKGDIERTDGDVTPEEFVQPIGNLAEQGKRLAADHGCLKCHTIDGTRHIGPTWLDLFHRNETLKDGSKLVVNEAYITESMMDPAVRLVDGFENVMPSFSGKLAGPEVAAIVEYIKSLQSESVDQGPSGGPVYAPVRGR
jgi:cytochrome c oxidase subunit II